MHYNDYKNNPLCFQKLHHESNKDESKEEEKVSNSIEEEKISSKSSTYKGNLESGEEMDINMLMHNIDNKNEYKINKSFFENEIENQNQLKMKKKSNKNIITFNKENIYQAFKDIDDDKSSDEDFEIKVKVSSLEESKSKVNINKQNLILSKRELLPEKVNSKEEEEEEDIDDEESFIRQFSQLIKKRELERENIEGNKQKLINSHKNFEKFCEESGNSD